MTSPDYEALHYPLASSTDWSPPTLHTSAPDPGGTSAPDPGGTSAPDPGGTSARSRGAHAAPEPDEDEFIGHGRPSELDRAAEHAHSTMARAQLSTGIDELGAPGTFGAAARPPAAWGATTYGGPRRLRPRTAAVVGATAQQAGTAAPHAGAALPSQWPPDVLARGAGAPAGVPATSAGDARDGADVDLGVPPTTAPPGWDELLDLPPGAPSPGAPSAGAASPGAASAGAASAGARPATAAQPATALGGEMAAHPWPGAKQQEPDSERTTRRLLANSKTMAIASLASRVTGFLRTAAIAAALGVVGNGVADAYNLANMLPNMVYELLIGGVLSSVLIPLLVRAQEDDRDGGLSYTQRLLAVATAVLGVATVVAALCAPLLTWALVNHGAQRDLATVWATLLLPEIFFYGLGALFTAVLNARNVYGAPAWAPVLNNLIILLTVGVYLLLPGPNILTPSTITNAQVLVLGIGTTLGIAVQALILWPFLRRVGFRWRWRFRANPAVSSTSDAGLKHERRLIAWVLGYVAVSQVGLLVISKVALSREGLTTFASADLLFQVPYGILGVSLLTALMPRMSRSAARGDFGAVLEDMSLGIRLSALALLPVTAGLMVLGPSLGTLIFFYGQTTADEARNVGVVLALGAFGLLPFAMVMLQLRVFYATHDARTPTLINIAMVSVKIVLVLAAAVTLDDKHVIQALAVATSMSYVAGAVVGHLALERRLGRLGLGPAAVVVGKVAAASAGGGLAAWLVAWVVGEVLGYGRIGALTTVIAGSLVGGTVCVLLLWQAKLPEVRQILASGRRAAGTSLERVTSR